MVAIPPLIGQMARPSNRNGVLCRQGSPPLCRRQILPPSSKARRPAVSNAHCGRSVGPGTPELSRESWGILFGIFPPRSAPSLAPEIPPRISHWIRWLGNTTGSGSSPGLAVPLGASLFLRGEGIRGIHTLHMRRMQAGTQPQPVLIPLKSLRRPAQPRPASVRFVLFLACTPPAPPHALFPAGGPF